MIFIFHNAILLILYLLLIYLLESILKWTALNYCWYASLLYIGILALFWELNIYLRIFFILFWRRLIKWICEFSFTINQVFTALVIMIGTIFCVILTKYLLLKIKMIWFYIILSLKIIMNQRYTFLTRTVFKLYLILIFNNQL